MPADNDPDGIEDVQTPGQLLGLLQGTLGDQPLSPASARATLAAVLGLEDPSQLDKLSADDAARALHRLALLARRLLAAAAVDDLTGALRRNPGLEAMHREIDRARREHHPLAVAIIDVDGLKSINDEHGHPAGDDVLRSVVSSLRRHFRGYDLVLRYGGDEFVCALPGADVQGAARRFAAVQDTLSETSAGRGHISVGLAELREGDSVEGLLARADADLYVSRRRRRRRRG
jgi:diguanylate cyclase (GGDEF)-like protein